MNASQLKPASELARKFGAKCIIYGPPGMAKTPISASAPRPVLCSVEPGLASMRKSNIPTWEADTPAKIEEFLKWVHGSAETQNYDTFCLDSISEIAEVFLRQELARNSHGMKAYGAMATRVMKIVRDLFYMPNKHVYLIAKQGFRDESFVNTAIPGFPGKELEKEIPHLFDEIFYINKQMVPGQPREVLAIRTQPISGIMARDRSGNLDELEPPNLTAIFNKCMA